MYEELYQCECGETQKHLVWLSELKKKKHPCKKEECKKKVGYNNIVIVEKNTSLPSVGARMSKQQIVTERKQRSTQHFKKEIYPTLSKSDKRHFDRKK